MRKLTCLCLLLVSGCATALDSGYEPRRLSATETQRKAFYASPYSEETQQAVQSDKFADPHPVRY